MKRNKSWLIMFAVVAALTHAQTVRGLASGEADDGRHPNVGALRLALPSLPNLANPAQFLSGTWIAPNLASHDLTCRIDTLMAQDFMEVVKMEYPLGVSFLAGDAKAAKRPPPALVMWPTGASVVLVYHPWYPGSLVGAHISAQWPIANGADHYRLTVVFKSRSALSVLLNESPAFYQVYGGVAYRIVGGGAPGSYTVSVTAYSGPDEAVAYSESLQAQITVR